MLLTYVKISEDYVTEDIVEMVYTSEIGKSQEVLIVYHIIIYSLFTKMDCGCWVFPEIGQYPSE